MEKIEVLLDEITKDPDKFDVVESLGKIGWMAHIQKIFPDESEKKGKFLQIYTECLLPDDPADKTVGYTNDDIIVESGIIVADIVLGEEKNVSSFDGECFEKKNFFKRHKVGKDVRDKVEMAFRQLKTHAYPETMKLDSISRLYNDGCFEDLKKHRVLH